MGTYDNQIALAKRLIAEKGQKVLLNTLTPGVKVNQWDNVADTVVSTEVDGVFFDDVRNGSAQVVDRKLIAYVSTELTITTKDTITRNGVELEIVDATPLSPNEQTIMWTLEIMR